MKTVMLSLFIALLMAGTAMANTLTFAVVDGNNDPANVAEYRIYMKHAGDAGSYENVGSVPDENTGLTITFADGYTYSLVATASRRSRPGKRVLRRISGHISKRPPYFSGWSDAPIDV
jgi:hypothetical protein